MNENAVREEVQEHCELCGTAHRGRVYAHCGSYHILACPRCGVLWACPFYAYSSALVDRSSYWAKDVYLSNALHQKKRFRKQLQLFRDRARIADLGAIRVLEVGSGLGFFLDVCQELGIPSEGCDISEDAVTYANRHRHRVRLGTLDGSYKDEHFDAVFAFNVVEHLAHWKALLLEAKRVLKRGGALILETPVQESLFHRISRLGYVLSGRRLNFLNLQPAGHIYKFSKKTFEFICDDLGFRRLYQANIATPFGEIWGKSSRVSFDGYTFMYRLALPLVYVMARVTRQGNRLFIILQK